MGVMGGGGGGVDVLWHVVMVVSLCTCVYSAGLFSFCFNVWCGKIFKIS